MAKKTKVDVHYNLYKIIAVSFFIISLILFFAIFYYTYKKAIVKISPNYELVAAEFFVDVKQNSLSEDSLEGKIMQVVLEEEKKFEVKTEIEEAFEGGITEDITITNENDEAITLVVRTRFLSEGGVLFRLKNYVNVPAGRSIEAQIYADNPDEITARIDPSKFTIPGLSEGLQKVVYGRTDKTINPNLKKVKILTQEEIKDARGDMENRLSQKALINFAGQIKSGERILSKCVKKEVLNFTTDKDEGDRTDSFSAELKIKFTTVLFDEDELFKIAKNKLSGTIADGKKLSRIDKENLVYFLEKYDLEGNTSNIRAKIVGKASLSESNKILDEEILTGMTVNEAISFLQSQEEIKEVDVKIVPSWVKKFPKSKNKIEIIIDDTYNP